MEFPDAISSFRATPWRKSIGILICTHDLDGLILSGNCAAMEIMGYSSDSYTGGTNVREILAPEVRDQVDDYLKRIRAEGVASGLMLVQTRTGEKRIWEYHNTLRTQGVSAPIVRGMARDITERRRADHSLRLFRTLIDRSSDAIEVIDPNTLHFLDCNKSAYQDLGYRREEFLSLSVYDIDPLVDERMSARHVKEIDRSGFVIFESIHRRKDGSTFPVEVNLKTVRLERDYRLAVVRDITERKVAEEALRQAEQKYRELFENARDPTYVHDLSGSFTSINRAAEKLSGYSSEEILGKPFSSFVAPEYVAHMRESLCKKLRQEGETTYEVEVITKDGRRVPVEVSSRLIYEEGLPVAVQGTARDIGERKRAEAALRESEERFAKAFHASPAALSVALLEDGRLLEVNDAFLRMTGYRRDEVIGRSTLGLGLWPDSNQRITMAGLLRERGTVTDLEIIFRKKSGEVRNGLLSVDLIELSGKPCVLGIAQDITERKGAEAALRNYSRLLIEAQEAERQNIARELHDQIGQVLTAIRINLQTIRKSSEKGESRLLIDEGMGMVDQALKQVRDLSFELRPSLLDDLGLTAALRRYADRYAQRTGIQTKTSICPESRIRLPRELETACFRIVQEALTNVARHAQAKNVSIDVRTTNGDLSLSIKDDGIGFNLHSQTNGELLSSLGLRGMEERAHGLGGELEIKSAPREGTEVRVHFPKGTKRKELT